MLSASPHGGSARKTTDPASAVFLRQVWDGKKPLKAVRSCLRPFLLLQCGVSLELGDARVSLGRMRSLRWELRRSSQEREIEANTSLSSRSNQKKHPRFPCLRAFSIASR